MPQMPQFDPLFQEWENQFKTLVEHLGALHLSPSYKALESSADFFTGETQVAIRDLQRQMNHVMADFAEFSGWMEKLRFLRARNPSVMAALISGRGAWEQEVEYLLTGPCIKMPIKGTLSIFSEDLPRVEVTPRQLFEELWREAKITEKAIRKLEDAQLNLNQEVASIEGMIGNFRSALSAHASNTISLSQEGNEVRANLDVLESLEKELKERVVTWGRDPLSTLAWGQLKSIQQQVRQMADKLAEERAAKALVKELLQGSGPKLAQLEVKAQSLVQSLTSAPFDPQMPLRLPGPRATELLHVWLEKLRASAEAGFPAKRVLKALKAWTARLEEFDSLITDSLGKMASVKEEFFECRGLYQALLVKSERKGLMAKEKVGSIREKLESVFSAKAVNLAEVKRLIKDFVEALC